MQLNRTIGTIALLTVVTLSAGVVATRQVWAQDDTASSENTMSLRDDVRQAGLEAAADILGMTPDEVADQLWGGKTPADLAEEANVELSDLREAVERATQSARQERIKASVAEQVAAGEMTQEQADWINEGIDNGWFGDGRFGVGGFGPEGFGLGRGGGMRMGRGMGEHGMHRPDRGQDQPEQPEQ